MLFTVTPPRGVGAKRAIVRVEYFAQRHRYVLRCDIVQHFASIDHAIALGLIRRRLPDDSLDTLLARIIASGDGIPEQQGGQGWFPGAQLDQSRRPCRQLGPAASHAQAPAAASGAGALSSELTAYSSALFGPGVERSRYPMFTRPYYDEYVGAALTLQADGYRIAVHACP